MKRKLLSVVISGVAALTAANAMADATVYGKANVSLQAVEVEAFDETLTDNWQLRSNASRFGIKGEEKLVNALSAVYAIEYEVDMTNDDGSSTTTLKDRNIYAGLKDKWGMIAAGNHDTPLKLAQGEVDQFNDLFLGDIKNVLVGEERVGNVMWYTSPAMSGFQATIAFVPGEDNKAELDGDDLEEVEDGNDGLADATSLLLTYTTGSLYLAVAQDSEVGHKFYWGGGEWDKSEMEIYSQATDATRLVGQYKVDAFTVGLIYQMAEASDSPLNEEQDGFVLSGSYAIDKTVLKLQYGSSSFSADGADEDFDTTQLALGADYKISKNTKVYGYYANLENEEGSDSTEANTFGAGVEIKF